MKLDDKDIDIIAQLKDNSRSSVRDIAKATGIRPSTVHQRIGRLTKEGVIEKFTLKLNNEAFGENFIVFMLVNTDGILDNKIFHNKSIKEAFGITGEYDLLLKMKFKDVNEFNKFILRFRKGQSIKKTLTMIGTVTIKEELN